MNWLTYFVYNDPQDARRVNFKQELIAGLWNAGRLVDNPQLADLILVLGGDGTMMDAVKKFHTYQKPFYGVNCGTLGFLLNEVTGVDALPTQRDQTEQVSTSFLVGKVDRDGQSPIENILAVNDCIIWWDIIHPMNFMVKYGGVQHDIRGTSLVISSMIGSTAAWLSYGGPIIEERSDLIGILGVGSGLSFNKRLIENQVIDIYCASRYPYYANFDGSWTRFANPTHISVSPSTINYRIAFNKNGSFTSKRAKLYQKAINTY